MKNKRLSFILALTVIFQLVLIISTPVYENSAFSRCERYGKECKIEVESIQVDIYESEQRYNKLHINLKNSFGSYMGIPQDIIGFNVDDEGFCVFDPYGYDKDKHTDSVKREFLYGRGYYEDRLIFSDGVTLQSICEYLEEKTEEEHWGEYRFYDFLSYYGVEAYITVKAYGDIMVREALYIDGVKIVEFQ